MANRYWVGGSGTWDNADTTHWSATSGGSSGASVPTNADDVFFDTNSGLSGATVTYVGVTYNSLCRDFTSTTGVSYTLTYSASTYFGFGRNCTLEAGIDLITIGVAGPPTLYYYNASGSGTLTSNGCQVGRFDQDALGTLILADNLNVLRDFYQENGTFDANGFNVTAQSYYFGAYDASYNIILNMGSGVWTATGEDDVWYMDLYTGASITVNAQTSTIKLTGATAADKTIVSKFDNAVSSSGYTYHNIWLTGAGTGSFIIQGSNTFNDFKVDTPPHTVKFTAGTTQTIATFTVSGTAGNLITLDGTTTATYALTKSGGGTISCDYLNIQHSVASPADTWYAGTHSTNNQAVATAGSGWIFTAPPVVSSVKSLGLLGVG